MYEEKKKPITNNAADDVIVNISGNIVGNRRF